MATQEHFRKSSGWRITVRVFSTIPKRLNLIFYINPAKKCWIHSEKRLLLFPWTLFETGKTNGGSESVSSPKIIAQALERRTDVATWRADQVFSSLRSIKRKSSWYFLWHTHTHQMYVFCQNNPQRKVGKREKNDENLVLFLPLPGRRVPIGSRRSKWRTESNSAISGHIIVRDTKLFSWLLLIANAKNQFHWFVSCVSLTSSLLFSDSVFESSQMLHGKELEDFLRWVYQAFLLTI